MLIRFAATSALRRLSRSPSPASTDSDAEDQDEDVAGIKDEMLEDQDAPTTAKREVSDQDKLR